MPTPDGEPYVRSIERANKEVGEGGPDNQTGLGLERTQSVWGYNANMNEDDDDNVFWVMESSNPGPWPTRFIRCVPVGELGQYVILDRAEVPIGATAAIHEIGKIDNEDQFFYCEVKKPGEDWSPAVGTPEWSNEGWHGDWFYAVWFGPPGTQTVRVIVRPR